MKKEMIEIPKELAEDIFSELVYLRRLREDDLLDYLRVTNEYERIQEDMYKDGISSTRKIYESLREYIDRK